MYDFLEAFYDRIKQLELEGRENFKNKDLVLVGNGNVIQVNDPDTLRKEYKNFGTIEAYLPQEFKEPYYKSVQHKRNCNSLYELAVNIGDLNVDLK